jgi:hypothetical protein
MPHGNVTEFTFNGPRKLLLDEQSDRHKQEGNT